MVAGHYGLFTCTANEFLSRVEDRLERKLVGSGFPLWCCRSTRPYREWLRQRRIASNCQKYNPFDSPELADFRIYQASLLYPTPRGLRRLRQHERQEEINARQFCDRFYNLSTPTTATKPSSPPISTTISQPAAIAASSQPSLSCVALAGEISQTKQAREVQERKDIDGTPQPTVTTATISASSRLMHTCATLTGDIYQNIKQACTTKERKDNGSAPLPQPHISPAPLPQQQPQPSKNLLKRLRQKQKKRDKDNPGTCHGCTPGRL